MDVVEIDGASNNGVDHIRTLRDNAQYSPSHGRYKIYLIDEVHMLTVGAFNALLKILEEPPAHVKFLFATTEAQKVPATITSRCQRFDLRRISDEKIANHLLFIAKEEEIDLMPEAAAALAKGADGGLRDAESMFDQVISFCGSKITAADVLDVFGFTGQEVIHSLAGHVLRCELGDSLRIVDEQDKAGKDLARLVDHLISYLRDLLILQAANKVQQNELASLVSREKMLELLEHFAECEGQIRWATDKRMIVDVGMIKAAHLLEQASLSDVIETIASLRDGQPVEYRQPARSPVQQPARPTRVVSEKPEEAKQSFRSEPSVESFPAIEKIEKNEGFGGAQQPAAKIAEPVEGKEVVAEKIAAQAGGVAVPSPRPSEGEVAAVARGGEEREGEEKWKRVVAVLAKEGMMRFGWLGDGVFQVENEGKIIVEFPESLRQHGEGMLWLKDLKVLEGKLRDEFGHPVKFHPEFSQSVESAEQRDSFPEEEPDFSPPVIGRGETKGAVPAPEKTVEKEEAAPEKTAQQLVVEKFRDDPLIRKAVEIFEAEIQLEQNA